MGLVSSVWNGVTRSLASTRMMAAASSDVYPPNHPLSACIGYRTPRSGSRPTQFASSRSMGFALHAGSPL
jgi:hypothetical protein